MADEEREEYVYKNSIKNDRKRTFFVEEYEVSDAAAHDSIAGKVLLRKKDKALHGDSAYTGVLFETAIAR